MLMTQLINPYRYGLFTLLYEAESPEGEMLIQYADKAWKGEKHVGETPVQIIKEVKLHGDKAVQAIEAVEKNIKYNRAEFERLKNDMLSYKALAYHYANKAEASLDVLRYKYTNDVKDLEKAEPLLQKSVSSYRQLVDLTKGTYLYANSMQTKQRKIPMRGVDGTYKHWSELLPVFENELSTFKHKIDSLKNGVTKKEGIVKPFTNANVRFADAVNKSFLIDSGDEVFADTNFVIRAYAKELKGLKGLLLPYHRQLTQPTSLQFSSDAPVKILVGYFKPPKAAFTRDTTFLKEPELVTNDTADDYGQAEIKISNAIAIDGMPPLNIHVYHFNAGTNVLKLGKGLCLILGFVPGNETLPVYDAMLLSDAANKNVDWLFE
jgi:hypothetical protein